MSEQLVLFIQKLKANPNISSYSEDAARQAIVLPILHLLGWDTYNVDEVFPEFFIGNGRVDYCLRANNKRVFLEAKKPSEELDRHQEQLLRYAFQEGVKLAILTNGITWSFYLPLKEGSWENRLFYTIDLFEQDPNEVADKFFTFLSKQNVTLGNAIKNAETILEGKRKHEIIEETIPEAWNKIVGEMDTILIDLISELTAKLCGFQPTHDQVKEFFRQYGDRFLLLPQTEMKELEKDKRPKTDLPPLKPKAINPIQAGKKISQDELIPYIIKILQKYGGKAEKEKVETEIYQMFQSTFEHPWYQEFVSNDVPRWQHNVAWAKERAKKRGLRKSPKDSGRGIWELTDAGRRISV